MAHLKIEPVVLVGGLGHDNLGGHLSHSLTEGHHRVRDSDLSATHKVILQIFQANFQMQLSSSGDDVLSSLLNRTLDHWIRLGQSLQSCKLRSVGEILPASFGT